MIEIKQATPKEAQTVALLGRLTFSGAFAPLFENQDDLNTYLETTFSVAKILRSFQKAENIFYLAYVNDLPVGYAKLKLNSTFDFSTNTKGSQLQKLYVLQDFLSMKIGSKLQSKMIQKSKDSGAETIWLSVYKGNEKAIRFYLKNDFHSIGEHDFQIGSQNFEFLAMEKKL